LFVVQKYDKINVRMFGALGSKITWPILTKTLETILENIKEILRVVVWTTFDFAKCHIDVLPITIELVYMVKYTDADFPLNWGTIKRDTPIFHGNFIL